MNWLETVMSKDELTKINNAMSAMAKYGDVFLAIAQNQAQITGDMAYEAGIEKVVKWVEKNTTINIPNTEDYCPEWQTFKEKELRQEE